MQLWYCPQEEIVSNFEAWQKKKAKKAEEQNLSVEEAQAIEAELESLEKPTKLKSQVEPSRSDQEKREYSYKRKLIRQTVRKKEGKVASPKFSKPWRSITFVYRQRRVESINIRTGDCVR